MRNDGGGSGSDRVGGNGVVGGRGGECGCGGGGRTDHI